jgi:hypothetical protein
VMQSLAIGENPTTGDRGIVHHIPLLPRLESNSNHKIYLAECDERARLLRQKVITFSDLSRYKPA